ncbi:MAG: alpha-galactosidase [Deltaproteobacteria bacterium]|nr:alpha-galactosidase [Deltaproteobacteria bacterium]
MRTIGQTWMLMALLAALACSGGEPEPEKHDVLQLAGQGFELDFDLRVGAFELRAGGQTVLEHASCEAQASDADGQNAEVFRSTGRYRLSGRLEDVQTSLGSGRQAVVDCASMDEGPDLVLRLTAYPDEAFFTAELEAVNAGEETFVLDRLVPIKVEAERGGALLVGAHPSTARILESGSFFLEDYFVDLVPGDVAESVETVALGMLHGDQKGHSISNWDHAIKDLESGRAFVAGSLDFEHASPMLNASFDPELAEARDGRTPFTYWSAEFPFLPNGKPLAPGARFSAGPVWILPATAEPLAGLEAYAAAVKTHNAIRLWTERGEEHRIPTGWNSWTGSGSSGGYGASIDEQLMLDNLAAMDEQFRDFGGEWFQIDDGYEPTYGDWDWRTDRFPHGSAWMADQIRARGLIPGVWIAPFQVDESSQTYAQHVEDGWFAERLPLVSGDKQILDLTHPEVQDWLFQRFRQIRAEGYRWLKTDFVYWALGAARFHEPGATREEAYRMGLAAVRDGLRAGEADRGDPEGDTFWLSVAMMGPHVGYVDSIRPNLDTMPCWEREGPDQARKEAQGFKPTVRTMARRYYFHNRIYLFNHDMLFFRSHLDPSVPPITAEESRCLLSAMALSGSVAKLGERIVEMQPAWIDDYRRVIPVYGHAARPLDLFEREYPEVWHLRVDPARGLNTGGAGPDYDVIALFNWGSNTELRSNPYSPIEDSARLLSANLSALGMDREYVAREFWTGEVIEGVSGRIERAVEPHTVQVFALREQLDRPQYLGGNRHVLQGAVEIESIDWDAQTASLRLTQRVAPGSQAAPWEQQLDFHVPEGFELQSVEVDGAADGTLSSAQEGRVLRIGFAVEVARSVEIALAFTTR